MSDVLETAEDFHARLEAARQRNVHTNLASQYWQGRVDSWRAGEPTEIPVDLAEFVAAVEGKPLHTFKDTYNRLSAKDAS